MSTQCEQPLRLPAWFKQPVPNMGNINRLKGVFDRNNLHTVCESAHCPNLGTCWERGTATFMILGNTCSRSCRFCAVPSGSPDFLDGDEPGRVAKTIKTLGLRYAVITSVTRDDIPDGGAQHFIETVLAIREMCPETNIELLIPDFKGQRESLLKVLHSQPDVLGHNIETVRRIFSIVRPLASYDRSLDVLHAAYRNRSETRIKSGVMVGMGETRSELYTTIEDIHQTGCEILTIGQYLAPGRDARIFPVARFVHPEEFSALRLFALKCGFKSVQSGPLVRSSFMAEDDYHRCTSARLPKCAPEISKVKKGFDYGCE